MDQFNQLWEEANQPTNPTEEIAKHEETDEYRYKQGVADTNLLIDILSDYFYAKHGEPRDPLFEPDCDDIEFVLK